MKEKDRERMYCRRKVKKINRREGEKERKERKKMIVRFGKTR